MMMMMMAAATEAATWGSTGHGGLLSADLCAHVLHRLSWKVKAVDIGHCPFTHLYHLTLITLDLMGTFKIFWSNPPIASSSDWVCPIQGWDFLSTPTSRWTKPVLCQNITWARPLTSLAVKDPLPVAPMAAGAAAEVGGVRSSSRGTAGLTTVLSSHFWVTRLLNKNKYLLCAYLFPFGGVQEELMLETKSKTLPKQSEALWRKQKPIANVQSCSQDLGSLNTWPDLI